MAPSLISSKERQIEYVPDYEKHLIRTAKVYAARSRDGQHSLPQGFPTEIQTGMTWEGNDFQSDEWVVRLTSTHLGEIDAALHYFQSKAAIANATHTLSDEVFRNKFRD